MYKLVKSQFVPKHPSMVWDFFVNPENLQAITPKELDFEILSDLPKKIYAGLIIEYRIKIAIGIPLRWVTEITHLSEQKFFVDEQRIGPYSFWHHQHHFEPYPGGTLVKDIVHYKLPLNLVGNLLNQVYVSKDLEKIFDYRYVALEKIFNEQA